jgi:hypothetical protein
VYRPATAASELPNAAIVPFGHGLLRKVSERLFGALSMGLLLATLASVPILQFFALGYLLHTAARFAESGRLRTSFVGLEQASRLGQVVLGVWLVSLPWRLSSSLAADAALIDPSARSTRVAAALGTTFLLVAAAVTLVAIGCGGRFIHFLRPIRATRTLVADVRSGDYLARRRRDLYTFVSAAAPLRILWLGFLGYVCAGAWLLLPSTLLAVGQKGPLALLGGIALVLVLLYLPLLQIHVAVRGRFGAIVELGAIRDLLRRAPLAAFMALALTVLLSLPLYLLKIELLPRDAMWLVAGVFVITILPTKLVSAWAYRRALRRREPAHGAWRWLARALMLAVAMIYASLVFLTPHIGWHGRLGLYEHHAFLLPVPF